MTKRVKCTSTHAFSGAHKDPYLEKGRFYTVLDETVYTMADETPYIRISDGHYSFDRPRHLFGKVLIS